MNRHASHRPAATSFTHPTARSVALAAIRRVVNEDGYSNLVIPAALGRSGLDQRDRGFAAEVLQPGSVQDPGSAPVGSLGEMPDPNAPLVTTQDGHVLLVEVAPAGRKRMPAADWARGARIRSGERLG